MGKRSGGSGPDAGHTFRKIIAQARATRAEALSDINEDTTISDKTKEDLRSQLGSLEEGDFREDQEELAKVSTTLEKARAGADPKFKARQLQKRQKSLLSDQPGRSQTILSRS